MNKEQVITLIQKIRELGDEDHARDVYKLANDTWPEWNLREAFEQLKAKS